MRSRLIALFIVISITKTLQAQSSFSCRIWIHQSSTDSIPADSARIRVFVTGYTTITDRNGYFNVPTGGAVSSYMSVTTKGNLTDTFVILLHHAMFQEFSLNRFTKAAEVIGRKNAFAIDGKGISKSEILNEGEFKKAACCTLSESFETSNTVEVSNADGVSGIRQVEMLGLSGKYILMTRDNMPLVRGFSVLTGLQQIPGPMVSGVHIAKGAGSVSNGFEGISGGLNYAIKADPKDPRLFLNGYINNQLRVEGNLISRQQIKKGIINHTYLHYGKQIRAMDQGKDGFTDMPLYTRYFIGDHLNFYSNKSEGQLGFTHTNDFREGGSVHPYHTHSLPGNSDFRFNMTESKTEVYGKLGIFLNTDGSKSMGNIFTLTSHHTKANLNNFDARQWQGKQTSLTYTGLYGSPESKKWSTKIGTQFIADIVDETYTGSLQKLIFTRNEVSAGLFSEIVRKTLKTTYVLGLRADQNNLYGLALTPRFHFRWAPNKKSTFHSQVGLGRRTAWVIAENLPYLISNRTLVINGTSAKGAYGMPREKAWNGGMSYVQQFNLFGYPATFSIDAYYTWFQQQVIADRDADSKYIFINVVKGSRSVSVQSDLILRPYRRTDVKLSYRYLNVQVPLAGAMRMQPLQSPHRALMTVSFENRKNWFFDLILQANSPKRFPLTTNNPVEFQMPNKSPWYALLNLQLRKNLKNSWEFYAGGENLLNFYQKNPVLSSNNPTSPYFDAAFAFGPVNGTNVFFGFRYSLK
jgi:outer membrane receptor for ferrienterochelin and colicins